MKRIALTIEYDGQDFSGWQAQENLATVQGQLESALSKIANEPITVICAGRTDAGVHAREQVVHFDTQALRDTRAWIQGTNTLLPAAIAVTNASEVDNNFHARFSALSRRYCYVIYNNKTRSALLANKVTNYHLPLNEKLMQAAAKFFLGEQDFSSFRSSSCESKTPFRKITEVSVRRENKFIMIEIEANAFLHHMVRNIVGVLLRVGSSQLAPEEVPLILAAKDRRKAFETAPAEGLYLIQVKYPSKYNLPVKDTALPHNLLYNSSNPMNETRNELV